MFPTGRFNGTTKGAAKSHWLEFEKYVDYQQQELALLPPNQFDSTKQMFRLTLTDNALGWYDAEQGNWTNIDQMKQAFLKRFNIWGDTRRQQQDSWNKLKFNMAKDDVDAFVTDMKTLASILGHDEHILIEKFKDVFPDKNIEAALIAMDDLDQMQAKAKQLVQIYKPSYETDTSSAGLCLVHTHTSTPDTDKKPKKKEKVSNQHELAPRQPDSRNYSSNDRSTNNPRNAGNPPRTNNYQQGPSNNQSNRGYYRENNFSRGRGRGGQGRGYQGQTQNRQQNPPQPKQNNYQTYNRGRGQGSRGRGRSQDRYSNTQYNPGQPQYNQTQQYHSAPPPPPTQPPPPYDPNWQLGQTQFYNQPPLRSGYDWTPQNQGQSQYRPTNRQSQQAQHVCELCGNRGHYDYQCQFATDFLNRTRKAFQRSHYMHESTNDQEWSPGDNCQQDSDQPFQ